jgi:hypothetical protein
MSTDIIEAVAAVFHHIPLEDSGGEESATPLSRHVNGSLDITEEILAQLDVPEGCDLNRVCLKALLEIDPELVPEALRYES